MYTACRVQYIIFFGYNFNYGNAGSTTLVVLNLHIVVSIIFVVVNFHNTLLPQERCKLLTVY